MGQDALYNTLRSFRDPAYQQMQRHLIPNIDPASIIGVRTPDLRRIAKHMKDNAIFLESVPHAYFEENQIHSFILADEKDFTVAIAGIESFLPHIDNWAVCDQLRPKIFRKYRRELISHIPKWLSSSHPYTIRFGISMLMCHYLDDSFAPEYLDCVAAVKNDHYYVKMMVAWYFATALTKQYEVSLPYIVNLRLDPWVHNKTIQKAVESYRITDAQKALLKTYRLRKTG